MGLNCGLNRVRFTHPVRSGSRVRCRLQLDKVEAVPHGLQLTFGVTIEIEGEPPPPASPNRRCGACFRLRMVRPARDEDRFSARAFFVFRREG